MDPRVTVLIAAFLAIYPDSEWGPGHIALSDGNLSDWHLRSCLDESKRELSEAEIDENEDEAVRAFLRLLLALPPYMRGEYDSGTD